MKRSAAVRWVKPRVVPEGFREVPAAGSLARAFERFGVPVVPDASPREAALTLLETAAEIEHGLLVIYLYTAYATGNSAQRRRIARVAKEEMGHLVSVQNLILVLDGRPHLGRYDASPNLGQDPFPFELAPYSKKALARFVLAERPSDDELTGEHAPLLEKVRAIATEQGFDPDHDITRVGVLYATLYWMFMRSDAPEGPWQQLPTAMLAGQVPHVDDRDIVDPGDRLATADEWQAFGRILVLPENVASEPIRDRALKAIFEIGRQGEAPTGPGPSDDSHFELFVTSYEEFDGASAKNVPTNPFYGDAADPDPGREANRISHPRSRAWAELADKRYVLLLLDIEKALQLAPTARATVVERAIDEMRVLRSLGDHLITLPRRDGDAAQAALCFMLPASPGGGETLAQRMSRLVRDSATLADRLRATETLPPVLGEDAGWENILTSISELDQARKNELQDGE